MLSFSEIKYKAIIEGYPWQKVYAKDLWTKNASLFCPPPSDLWITVLCWKVHHFLCHFHNYWICTFRLGKPVPAKIEDFFGKIPKVGSPFKWSFQSTGPIPVNWFPSTQLKAIRHLSNLSYSTPSSWFLGLFVVLICIRFCHLCISGMVGWGLIILAPTITHLTKIHNCHHYQYHHPHYQRYLDSAFSCPELCLKQLFI